GGERDVDADRDRRQRHDLPGHRPDDVAPDARVTAGGGAPQVGPPPWPILSRCPQEGVWPRELPMSALTADTQAFRHYIRAERGLADNTQLAYGRDLDRFGAWAQRGGLADYLTPSVRELSNYISFLREDEGLAPTSVARHLVALKMFYRFLRLEE